MKAVLYIVELQERKFEMLKKLDGITINIIRYNRKNSIRNIPFYSEY